MPLSYLERYLAGEYTSVWRDLIDLGGAIREEPFYTDAIEVCREIVDRARVNLRLLYTRLTALGYQFADPAAAFVDAGPDAEGKIREIEAWLLKRLAKYAEPGGKYQRTF